MNVVNAARNPNLGSDVAIASIFGGTTPAELTFNSGTQLYDLQEAKTIFIGYFLNEGEQLSDYGQQMIDEWLAQAGNSDLEI